MAGNIGPREARLREMRESLYEERQKRAAAKPSAKPEAKAAKVAKARALSNTASLSNAPKSNRRPVSNTTAVESNTPVAPFDKAAYQRDYMRKLRAKAKAAN